MSLTNNFFAVDLGATSGRTILGTLKGNKISFKEITRFTYPIVEVCGHYHWDILNLYNEIINGLKCVKQSVGLDSSMFGRYVNPGDQIGTLNPTVQKLTGLGPVPVLAVAGHDTASAIAAVPAKDEKFAYLSSGTWSLMGIEVKDAIINEESFKKNFTNEGGVNGTIRFLKNICGMWLIENCRKIWGDKCGTFDDIQRYSAETQPFRSLINPDAPIFASPHNMLEAIQKYCSITNQPKPSSIGEFSRCIYDSLALRYRQVCKDLQNFAPFNIDSLNVIGGASVNKFMNHETSNALQIPVFTGPKEATALGNICV